MPKGQEPPDLLQLSGSVLRLARALERGIDEALGPELELGGRDYLLLRLVQQGVNNPGDVANELNLPAANVSRAIGRLADAGLLERNSHPTDQRRALLRLTEAGEATVDFARERVTAWLEATFARFTGDWLAGTQQRLGRLVEQAGGGRDKTG